MKEFVDATNYNLGIRGNLTKVCVTGIALAQERDKLQEILDYLKELPPVQTFDNPSVGLDSLVADLNGMQELEEVKTR